MINIQYQFPSITYVADCIYSILFKSVCMLTDDSQSSVYKNVIKWINKVVTDNLKIQTAEDFEHGRHFLALITRFLAVTEALSVAMWVCQVVLFLVHSCINATLTLFLGL